MKIHTDCRHYRTSRPCHFHKRAGLICDRCADYDPLAERILFVKLDSMGDVLRTTTCLEPLRQRYPRAHVTWITRANAACLFDGNPLVDRVLTIESNYLEYLLVEKFDLALGPDTDLLPASIMRIANASAKRGFIADGRGGVVPLSDAADTWWRTGINDAAKRANRRTYGEWLYAMCELPMPVARPWLRPTASALDAARLFLRSRQPHVTRWVCFNTGASDRWREKRWKADHYQRLAAIIGERSPATGVLLVGGPAETEVNERLLAADKRIVNGGTDNSIQEFAALVASCDWVLTADSLGYHVACAVRTPALCIVGPTSPWELDLYGTNQIVHADLDCIACYLSRCPHRTTCMDAVTADAIYPLVHRAETGGGLTSGVLRVGLKGSRGKRETTA